MCKKCAAAKKGYGTDEVGQRAYKVDMVARLHPALAKHWEGKYKYVPPSVIGDIARELRKTDKHWVDTMGYTDEDYATKGKTDIAVERSLEARE